MVEYPQYYWYALNHSTRANNFWKDLIINPLLELNSKIQQFVSYHLQAQLGVEYPTIAQKISWNAQESVYERQ